MLALFEAVTVDKSYRANLWKIRERHVARFVHTVEGTHGIGTSKRHACQDYRRINGVDHRAICKVWYAQEKPNEVRLPLDTAAHVMTMTWYRTVFFRQNR
jgi:hypothetical protein